MIQLENQTPVCLLEQGSVRNLRVSEETTNSFRVTWQRAPGAIVRYRLTYKPVGFESSEMETTTSGSETTLVLQSLQPRTTYRVTVTPMYQSGAGMPLQTDGTTEQGEFFIVIFSLFTPKVSMESHSEVIQLRQFYKLVLNMLHRRSNTKILVKHLKGAKDGEFSQVKAH